MTLAAVGQYIVSGLTAGSIYAMIALGFTLIYNTCDLVNFAQGEFAMLGGMAAVAILVGLQLPLWLTVVLAILITACIGGLAALIIIFPLRRVSSLGLIIMTIGLAIVLRGASMLIWGKDATILPVFFDHDPIRVYIGGGFFSIQWQAVWVLSAAVLVAAGLFLFFKLTNMGRAMRACAANRRGARICGINPQLMMVIAFMLSAGIGAIGGIVTAPITTTGYDVGIMIGLKGFCGAIIGGLRSLVGAVVGGLLIGLLESLGAGLIPSRFQLTEILPFVALLGILYLRPTGLFGGRGA